MYAIRSYYGYLAVSAAGVAGLTAAGLALAAPWNLQPAVTKIAADIHSLHEYVMILRNNFV